ncbi:hypothetical protein B0H10DRAFT_2073397 [Mycena sp. CBHHK59/15]|nr:hypothetical protein B0H10DRAFT_2073397 [Mycena sp. CBHHK59/15]
MQYGHRVPGYSGNSPEVVAPTMPPKKREAAVRDVDDAESCKAVTNWLKSGTMYDPETARKRMRGDMPMPTLEPIPQVCYDPSYCDRCMKGTSSAGHNSTRKPSGSSSKATVKLSAKSCAESRPQKR